MTMLPPQHDFENAKTSRPAPAIAAGEFQAAVLDWFDHHGRKDLPWQKEPTPYRIWISETMLQQTQVAAVIPYFQRFMERFPELEDLTTASQEEVLQQWAGLGYYARARNLHRTAQIVQHEHDGVFPDDLDGLCALPGIGRSTAGAILSLGLGIRAPILDGNVKRVLSRCAGIAGWPGETRTAQALWRISERLTPAARVAEYTQAMMDLGATLCTRNKPACPRCPIQTHCLAFRLDKTEALPAPRPKRTLPIRQCCMLALRNGEGAFYLQKRPAVGVWGGLWSFPEFGQEAELHDWCKDRGIDTRVLERLPERRHTFTHFHLDYLPVTARTPMPLRVEEDAQARWRKRGEENALPAPVRRLMNELGDVSQASQEM